MLHVVPAGIIYFTYGYTITNALMFDGSADYLSWTPSSTASSNTDKTISFWVKRVKFGSVQWVLDVASNGDQIQYTSGDQLEISLNATTDSHYTTKAKYRDPTAWTHIVIAFDTDSGTAANKKRLWINGVLQEDAVLDNHDDPADSANVDWMKASIAHNLGRRGNNSQFFAGYLAEFIGVDGTAYEASNFGEYDSKGIWVPVKPPTSLGTNGFHLDFKSANIGNDAAGSNNWTAVSSGPNNVVVNSSTDDSSTEVTLYPALDGVNTTYQQGTLSNNNKTMTVSSGAWSGYRINMPVTSGGKIYFEFTIAGHSGQGAGLTTISGNIDQPGGGSPYVGKTGNYSMQRESGFWTPSNAVNVPTGHETGSDSSYYKCAYDDSNGKLWFGDADGWYGSSVSDSDVANGDDNTYTVAADDRGGKLFIYCSGYTNGGNTTLRLLSTEWSSSAPSGFSALTETVTGVGNYWTLNPLASTDTLTNGNLSFTAAANFTTYVTAPAIPMSGKWYYEVTATGGDQAIGTSASYDAYLGLVRTDVAIPTGSHDSNNNLWVIANWNPTPSGQKENGSSAGGSYAPTSGFGDGSIIMVAIDMDNNAMWFGNDGTWAGSATASEIANGTTTNAAFTNSSNNSFGSNQMMPYHAAHSDKATYNFGATAFAHTPPTGFKALNTANLPAPTVTKPNDHYKTITYEGAVVDSSSRHTASAVTLPDNTNTTFTVGGQTGSLAQIIDNNSSTAGIRITGAGAELSFDLGSAKAVGAVGMFMDNGGGNSQACTWSVLYSDNNSDFTDTSQDVAYSDNGESSSTEVIKTFSGSHGTHRYWKLRVESKTSETASSGGIYGINLYSANAREITGVGFQPDFVWIKNRDASDNHMLFDSVRGATKDLHSNTADTEATTAESLKSFDTDGFTLGTDDQVNTSSESYVAWCWKAGTSWSEDAQNSNILASSGKKSSTAKFSIATWEHRGGSDGNYAIKHNLGTTPEFFITKSVDQATNWSCWHKDLGDTAKRIVLSTAKDEEASYWADASDSADGSGSYANISSGESPVTSTLFAIQDDEAGAGTFIGYFFARTPGLIGIGSYTGNNSTDGPYVVIDDGASGFRPAFLLLKEFDGSDNGSWFIRDSARNTYNPTNLDLYAQATDDEYTDSNSDIDFTANGFKIRANAGGYNESGAKNLYLAFAEHPFGGDGVAQARAR